MLCILAVNVIFPQAKMMMFYYVHTINMTFVDQKTRYTIYSYSIMWFQLVCDTKYNIYRPI